MGLVAIDMKTGHPLAFVDTAREKRSLSEAFLIGPVADDPGAMWVIMSNGISGGRLHKVHLSTMRIDAGIDFPTDYGCCVAQITRAGIVVTDDDGGIAFLDPRSGRTLARRTVAENGGLKYACGLLWMSNDDRLLALDEATLYTVHSIPMNHLGGVWPAGPSIWFTTADDDRLVGTIGVINGATTERTKVATFPLYEVEGRGGKYVWSPGLQPVEAGVIAFDERSGAYYFLADPRTDGNQDRCPAEPDEG